MNNRAYRAYAYFLFFLIVALNLCDRSIISILVDDIRRDVQLSDRELGFVMGLAFTVPHMLFAIPIARLADKYSRTFIVTAATFLWSAMTIFTGYTQSFAQLVISRAGVSIGEAGGNPPIHSLLTDLSTASTRAKAMSLVPMAGLVGMGLGVLYGGWASHAYGWRFALIYVGIFGMLVSLLFFFTIREPARRELGIAPAASLDTKSMVTVLAHLARMKSFGLLVAGASFVTVVSVGKFYWEPTLLRRVYGYSPQDAGLYYFIIAAIPSILGALAGGILVDRLARRDWRWYAYCPAIFSLLSLPFLLAFYFTSAGHVFLGVPLGFYYCAAGSFFGSFWGPCIIALAQFLVPSSIRAVTAATWTTIAALVGSALGPFLVGDLNMRFAPEYGERAVQFSLAAVSSALIIAAVMFHGLGRNMKQRALADGNA